MDPITSSYTGPMFCKKCGGVLPNPDECVCQPENKSDKGEDDACSGEEEVSVYQGREEGS